MREPQRTPPEKLFELLEFCGIRQRDIVKSLGVSKALVSLWRSGHREITPEHFATLIGMAHVAHYRWLIQRNSQTLAKSAPASRAETTADVAMFTAKLQAAHAEHDPTPTYHRLLDILTTLHATLIDLGEPTRWNDEALPALHDEADTIETLLRLIDTDRRVQKSFEDAPARATALLQETPYATAHDRRQCAS